MAKVSLTKIAPIKKGDIININIGEETIQLKSYLPIVEKSILVEDIVNGSLDATNHINDMRAKMLFVVYVIQKYTNINFTEKQLENITELYDLIKLNGIDKIIFDNFNQQEYKDLQDMLNMTIDHVNEYVNSFAGVLRTITEEQNNSQANIDNMLTQLQSIANNSTLKDVLDNLKKEAEAE